MNRAVKAVVTSNDNHRLNIKLEDGRTFDVTSAFQQQHPVGTTGMAKYVSGPTSGLWTFIADKVATFGNSSDTKNHKYAGNVTTIDTPLGVLELWETGTVGGRAEVWYALLLSPEQHPVAALIAFAEERGLKRGDCVNTSRIPNAEFGKKGVVATYAWTYFPSTD